MAEAINYNKVHFVASYGKASQIPPSTCPEVSFVGSFSRRYATKASPVLVFASLMCGPFVSVDLTV